MAKVVGLGREWADHAPGEVCACAVAVLCVLARVRLVSRNFAPVRGSAPRPRSFVGHYVCGDRERDGESVLPERCDERTRRAPHPGVALLVRSRGALSPPSRSTPGQHTARTRVASSRVSASPCSVCMRYVAASPPHLRRCGVGLVLEQSGFGKPVVITQVSFHARAFFHLALHLPLSLRRQVAVLRMQLLKCLRPDGLSICSPFAPGGARGPV